MIGELIGGGTRTPRAPARAEPVKTAEAAPAKAADPARRARSQAPKPGAEPKAGRTQGGRTEGG